MDLVTLFDDFECVQDFGDALRKIAEVSRERYEDFEISAIDLAGVNGGIPINAVATSFSEKYCRPCGARRPRLRTSSWWRALDLIRSPITQFPEGSHKAKSSRGFWMNILGMEKY